MTKEQIEKAAKEAEKYSRKRMEENERYKAMFTRSEIKQAFEDGAEWRINSVWHTNTEMPSIGIDEYGSGKDCLVKPKYGVIENGQVIFDEGIYVISCNNTTYTMDEIEAWAYVEDLLYTEKEV